MKIEKIKKFLLVVGLAILLQLVGGGIGAIVISRAPEAFQVMFLKYWLLLGWAPMILISHHSITTADKAVKRK